MQFFPNFEVSVSLLHPFSLVGPLKQLLQWVFFLHLQSCCEESLF